MRDVNGEKPELPGAGSLFVGESALLSARVHTALWIIFGCLVAWWLVAVPPFAGVEGDDFGIMAGAHDMALRGLDAHEMSYRFAVQPATYYAVLAGHVLTGVETMTVFSVISAVAVVAFIAFAAAFIRTLTGLPLVVCLLLVWAFPEARVTAYYPSSTAFASACSAAAFYVLASKRTDGRLVVAGLLFGAAAAFRADAVLVTPAVLPLLWTDRRSAVRGTTVVAVATAATALLLLTAMGSSPADIIREAAEHSSKNYGLDDFASRISFWSVLAAALVIAGAVELVRQRNWRPLAMAGSAVIVLEGAYFGALASPRYLIPLIPLLAMVAAWSIPFVLRTRGKFGKTVILVVAVAAAVQAFVGIDPRKRLATGLLYLDDLNGSREGLRRRRRTARPDGTVLQPTGMATV